MSAVFLLFMILLIVISCPALSLWVMQLALNLLIFYIHCAVAFSSNLFLLSETKAYCAFSSEHKSFIMFVILLLWRIQNYVCFLPVVVILFSPAIDIVKQKRELMSCFFITGLDYYFFSYLLLWLHLGALNTWVVHVTQQRSGFINIVLYFHFTVAQRKAWCNFLTLWHIK